MRPIESRTLWLLAGIILVNLVWQSRTFFTAHVTGDQRLYVALAMKLDQHGFGDYNLRRVDVRPRDGFVEFIPAETDEGDLLIALKEWGTPFYDQPLFHTPPLFAGLLALSHRLFGGEPEGFVVLGRAGEESEPRGRRLLGQFYACAIPVGASVVLLVGTFAIGRRWFSDEVGLGAALLLAISPVQVLAGERLWADAPLAALVTLTMACWVGAMQQGKRALWLAAATCLGLAALTKITAWLMAPALLYAGWRYDRKVSRLGTFWVVAVAWTVPWYVLVWRVLGVPFFAPQQPGISVTHEWFALINQQPWYTYLTEVPFQVPVFVLGYVGALRGLARWDRGQGDSVLAVWWLTWLAALTLLTSRNEMLGPEHRYLLPAYPALAVLTAHQVAIARAHLHERSRPWIANVVVAAVWVSSAAWGWWIAWQSRGYDEIVLPF